MPRYYLAVDIGASSGRHILSHMEDGSFVSEEIYRFENGFTEKNGHKVWDIDELFRQIKLGLHRCTELGKIPVSVGIDTWGVDFVLLDKQGNRIGDAVAYRDARTQGIEAQVYEKISMTELYHRTGIQKQPYNTIFQLAALQKEAPEQLEQAACLLMVPDYLHYRLTGVLACEYTAASTTGMLSAEACDWDSEILAKMGLPSRIFLPLTMPGTVLGSLSEEIAKEVGFSCEVVLPASHDTGSAVVAIPATDADSLFLSSGTWSLFGVERMEADCRSVAAEANFTNEGGYQKRYRFLKNIMGLWMLQSLRREWKKEFTYDQICQMAKDHADFPSLPDVNDILFLAPDSMEEAVRTYCRKTNQPVPTTKGEVAACVYRGLAHSYGVAVRELEAITGRKYSKLHIVGGGSRDEYLNALTKRETGMQVFAGPGEGTAIGNLCVQMITDGVFADLTDARRCIYQSFQIQEV